MVPDRWETVWRTLVFFRNLLHITPTGAALSCIDHGWIGRQHKATSDTRVVWEREHHEARNQLLYDGMTYIFELG